MKESPDNSSAKKPRRWLRRLGLVAIVLPLLLWAVRLWVVQGIWTPIYVHGDSMAPHLLGEHWQVTCDDCGCGFAVARPGEEERPFTLCPNCGWRHNDLRLATSVPGQRVYLTQLPRWISPLERWQVVAVRTPGQPGRFSVKRIVGLPGEQLEIREGDVYANGAILRKSLREFRELAVLVHADAHRTSVGDLPPRWAAEEETSPWQRTYAGYTCAAEDVPELTWLTYRHWSCQAPPGNRLAEVPPLDNYGYNRGVSRMLNVASDLLLTARVRTTGSGRIALSAHDGRETWQAELKVEQGIVRRVTLAREGVPVGEWESEVSLQEATQLEWAVCDRQVLLSLAGKQVFAHEYERGEAPWVPGSRPLALAAAGLKLEVEELTIWRDLVYLNPRGLLQDWQTDSELGDDELWLLGDNCPVSRDSRNWPGSGVKMGDVLGPVWFSPVGEQGR